MSLEAVGALREPVRRAVYEYVAAQAEPVSRNDVAAAVDIGRTLAAFHLDKLAEAGLLETANAPRPGGPGAGRPAKLYRRSDSELMVSLPPRDYRLLAAVLASVARLRAPLDSPALADFVALLPEVNGLAERTPGYVWRLRDESGDATALRPFDPDVIVNLTVWQSVEALRAFTYRTAGHLEPMRRRRDWFVPLDGPHLVLWWIPAGSLPTIAEAAERLDRLRQGGPSPEAFTFREPFPDPVGVVRVGEQSKRGALG